jgi:hypothetical protein
MSHHPSILLALQAVGGLGVGQHRELKPAPAAARQGGAARAAVAAAPHLPVAAAAVAVAAAASWHLTGRKESFGLGAAPQEGVL